MTMVLNDLCHVVSLCNNGSGQEMNGFHLVDPDNQLFSTEHRVDKCQNVESSAEITCRDLFVSRA